MKIFKYFFLAIGISTLGLIAQNSDPLEALVIIAHPNNFVAEPNVYERSKKQLGIEPENLTAYYFKSLCDSMALVKDMKFIYLTPKEQDDFTNISSYKANDKGILEIKIDQRNIEMWNMFIDKYRPDYFLLINKYEVNADIFDKLAEHSLDIEVIGNNKIIKRVEKIRANAFVKKELKEKKLGILQKELVVKLKEYVRLLDEGL